MPSVTDEANGQKVKELLAKIEGVKSVAVYPKQRSVAVLFTGKGSASSQAVIDALSEEGIDASNF